MFAKHPMSEKITNSHRSEPVCSPPVPTGLPLMLHLLTKSFVAQKGIFFKTNS